MKEKLIEFKTAKLAKEKGFDINTKNAYAYRYKEHESESYEGILTNKPLHCDISAPTQSILQAWFRKEHNIHISIEVFNDGEVFYYKSFMGYTHDEPKFVKRGTYEEALEEGLIQALNLIH